MTNVLESFTYGKNKSSVKITEDFSVFINGEKHEQKFSSLEEAKKYCKDHISTLEILEDIDLTIPENKVASYIKKHYNIEKITDTPVVLEMKLNSSLIAGKLDYTLEDKSVVAISESTQNKLNMLMRDRADVVQYMRESKENFMRVVKEI